MASPIRKPVIGLAGGIGSGKSLVARQLEAEGCAVIDADDLARRALDDPAVTGQLVQWWGPDVLDAEGRINRAAVAELVFGHDEQLQRLEAVIHPKVQQARRCMHRRYQADPTVKAIVEDSPLLFEKGLDADCDVTIFVACDLPNRLRRLAANRGWTAADLSRREKNQLPLAIKAAHAYHIIDNNAGRGDCLSRVRRVFSQVLYKFKC